MLTCMFSCSYSHFTYGFKDVGKDQTTVNINHLQQSLQFNELIHLEPALREFRRHEAEPFEQLKMHIFTSNHIEHKYS